MSAPHPSDKRRAAPARLEVRDKSHTEPLRDCVKEAFENYFRHLDGHDAKIGRASCRERV